MFNTFSGCPLKKSCYVVNFITHYATCKSSTGLKPSVFLKSILCSKFDILSEGSSNSKFNSANFERLILTEIMVFSSGFPVLYSLQNL